MVAEALLKEQAAVEHVVIIRTWIKANHWFFHLQQSRYYHQHQHIIIIIIISSSISMLIIMISRINIDTISKDS